MADLNPSVGYLVVAVTTQRGLQPLEGALVTISAQVDGQPQLYRVARTDSSGRTPVFALPAPAVSESLTPDQPLPYASYAVAVDLDGYQSVDSLNVPIFPGVAATFPVAMTPSQPGSPPVREQDFPPESLNTNGGE